MKPILIITLVFVACNYSREKTEADYFSLIRQNDQKLGEPVPGDWRLSYDEPSQSFLDYQKDKPKKAAAGKTVLYLLPIGSFTEKQNSILHSTREYLEIFFQLPTILLPAVSDSSIPDSSKRTREGNTVQLHTAYILEKMLKNKIPANGYALMAISEKDLYPGPSWNFVFGIASYAERIGVSSIARLQGNLASSSDYQLCLKRLSNVGAHEIGHMFSIHHCVGAACVMNGSNSLNETDRCPGRLCSACQQKLYWNTGYDNKKRLAELITWFKKNNFSEELAMAEKDFNLLSK